MWMGGREEDEMVSHRDKMVDSVMGVRRPTFKRAYNATRLNSNYVYNSITMMMVSHVITALGHVITALSHVITVLGHVITALGHVITALGHVIMVLSHVTTVLHHVTSHVNLLQPYSDYSFEELRLFAPKVKRYVCVRVSTMRQI